jgi:hypothetical protein
MRKANETVRTGVSQLKSCSGKRKLLAININTPDHTIEQNWLIAIKELICEQSSGTVEGLLFLGYRSLMG